MIAIFKQTFKEKKWTILIYITSGILLLWMYIALFPSIQKSIGDLNQYMQNLPQGFLKAFGFDAASFGTFEGYIGSEQFTFVWPILLISFMVSFGSAFLSGEIEKGTMEFLLSQPVSRIKIFLGKLFAGILNLVLFVIVSILAVFPLAKIYDISIKSEGFYKLTLLGFVFGLAIFGLAMLFSAIFSEKSKATFTVVGILIGMYVLNIMSGLKDNLDKLKYISFFHYFVPSDILVHNQIDNKAYWIFLGTFLIASFLGLIWFKKRDVAI